jgi:urease accessory protein
MDSSEVNSPASWFGAMLQLNDSFYPTGSYAHSFGLEGLIHENVVRDRESLSRFLNASVVPALRNAELPVAAQAWRMLAGPDWDGLRDLSLRASALKSAREARIASENIGRQRSELLAKMREHALALDYLRRAQDGRWPFSSAIAAALEGRVVGAPMEAVLGSLFYTTIAAQLAAAMKLLRVGQNATQSILTEIMSHLPETIEAAKEVPLEEIGWFNPWLDISAARHESADARLFIS